MDSSRTTKPKPGILDDLMPPTSGSRKWKTWNATWLQRFPARPSKIRWVTLVFGAQQDTMQEDGRVLYGFCKAAVGSYEGGTVPEGSVSQVPKP